mmetsp:Transcript_9873/g.28645  ORF Transcript_9873/g.28645 Transcript_9873/m.28645 type:complete len:230 (+) Transcript_9873:851-1540(+)
MSSSKPAPRTETMRSRISPASRKLGKSKPDAARTSGCFVLPADDIAGRRRAKRRGPVSRTSKQHRDNVATSPTMGTSPKLTERDTISVEPAGPPSRRSISGRSSGRCSSMPSRTAATKSQAALHSSSWDLSPTATARPSAPHVLKVSMAVRKSLQGNGVPAIPDTHAWASFVVAGVSRLKQDNVSGWVKNCGRLQPFDIAGDGSASGPASFTQMSRNEGGGAMLRTGCP